MNVMLHKRCAKFIYVIPEGLRELMSDISREVLRSQPVHIYTFVADYLDALMITRENARVAAKLVESIAEIGTTIVELLLRTGLSREQADRMAAIIQNAFRKYTATRSRQAHVHYTIEEEENEEMSIISGILEEYGEHCKDEQAAAEIILKAFRHFREKHGRESELLSGMIDWRVAARSAIYLYRKSGVTNEEANRAATLIKSAYKGYYTRRIMQRLVDEGRRVYQEEETEASEENYEESSEQLDPLTGEATAETETKLADSINVVERFMASIIGEAVPEDFGAFSGDDSREKHEAIAEILQGSGIQESLGPQVEEFDSLSFYLDEFEHEEEGPLIIGPSVTEVEAGEQQSSPEEIAEITEETVTESLTQTENADNLNEKDFYVQDDADEIEQSQTDISDLLEVSPAESTEITDVEEN